MGIRKLVEDGVFSNSDEEGARNVYVCPLWKKKHGSKIHISEMSNLHLHNSWRMLDRRIVWDAAIYSAYRDPNCCVDDVSMINIEQLLTKIWKNISLNVALIKSLENEIQIRWFDLPLRKFKLSKELEIPRLSFNDLLDSPVKKGIIYEWR